MCSGSSEGLSRIFNIGQNETSTVREGHQLFVFHHTVQRNSKDLHSTKCDVFFLQNLQCLEGWNSAFEEDMPHMEASDQTHASENKRS